MYFVFSPVKLKSVRINAQNLCNLDVYFFHWCVSYTDKKKSVCLQKQ